MASAPEQLQTLAAGGRRSQVFTILANYRNFTILRSPALFVNHPENPVLTRFSGTRRLARKLSLDLEQSAERRR
jgi:hypothetical protein